MQTSVQSSRSPVRILIAEDSPTQAQRLQYILQQQGYEVAMAANGRIALEMVEKFKPILIISDVNMPEIDGYELARRVKAYPHSHNIPVILVTTMSDPQDVILGLECGADTFVLKPYDEQYLLGRVRYVLANREMRREDDVGMGVEIYFHNRKHFITADRLQILNLLLSTYDAAMQSNKELKHSKETLEKRSAEVDAANRAKSIFLATMSHEIRTPMNGVLGMLELLSLTKLDAEQRKSLGIVRESGKSLLRIIDDILDFSKIEAGKLTLEKADFKLRELVRNSVSVVSAAARAKHLEIVVAIDDEVPDVLVGDPVRVRQILLNLLSNSVKFTDRGTVRVSLSAKAASEPECILLRVSVSDTGIGIPEETQKRLFQSFSQAETSTTRRYGGTGLGLAISKRLVELMGGEVGFESSSGQGSKFWFTAKLGLGNEALRSESRPTQEGLPHEQNCGTILIVEDNRINQKVLSHQLINLGYMVEVAENGAQAVAKVKTSRYDLILMDVQMPVMDGFQATQEIRSLAEASSSTPIVAVTANAFQSERERCISFGMDDYLAKPVDKDLLQEVLQRWARAREAR